MSIPDDAQQNQTPKNIDAGYASSASANTDEFTLKSIAKQRYLIVGCVLLALSSVVIFGWIASVERLVRIDMDSPTMQIITAVCFWLCGIALVLLNKQRHIARAAFILVLGFSALFLFEYLFNTNLGIDELLIKDIYVEDSPYPGRMSPLTAASFFAISLAYLHFSYFSKNSSDAIIVRIALLSPIFLLIICNLLSYIIGFDIVYRWTGSTGMAVHTALGFFLILCGSFDLAGITGYQHPNSKISPHNATLLGLSVGFLGILLLLKIWTTRTHQDSVERLLRSNEIDQSARYLSAQLTNITFLLNQQNSAGNGTFKELYTLHRKEALENLNLLLGRVNGMDSALLPKIETLENEFEEVLDLLDQFFGNEAASDSTSVSSTSFKIANLISRIDNFAQQSNTIQIDENTRFDKVNTQLAAINMITLAAFFLSLIYIAKQYSSNKLHTEIQNKNFYIDKVLSNTSAALYVFDFSTAKNTLVNAAYTKITGYSQEELENVSDFTELLHPDDRVHVIQHRESIKKSSLDKSFSIEYRFRHKQGHWIWCLSNDSAFSRDYQGNVKEMIGSFADVTELKKKQEQLAKTRTDLENMGLLLDRSLNEIFIFDQQSLKFVKVNQTAIKNIGYSTEELFNLTPVDIKPSHTIDSFKDLIAPLATNRLDKLQFETLHRRKDGSFYHCYIELIKSSFNDLPVYVATILDVSDLKKSVDELAEANANLGELNGELQRKNRELQEFAYVASHDLQEPLRKLVSFSGLLQQDIAAKNQANITTDLNYIVDAASRMRQLVQDLLELSRTGMNTLNLKNESLNSIVDEAISNLSSVITESNALVTRDELPDLIGDHSVLLQIFQNLIGNAIKFALPNKPAVIHIGVDNTVNPSEFFVSDNGIGIEAAYYDKIFLPFKRLHGRSEYSGSGIGLSICKKAIERFNGKIWLESEPGKGTTFKFTLGNINDE